MNPTVSFQVGDISRIPVPNTFGNIFNDLVIQAISLGKEKSIGDEITFDFITPPGLAFRCL